MSAVLSNLQPNSVAPHPEESTVLLEMKGIHKSFPGVRALCGVELTVKRGKVHALIGENGAGKSTLMKILGGIYQPDEGSIRFKGEPLAILDPKDSIRCGIAMIHQELSPIPEMTIAENVFLGREPVFGFTRIVDRRAMHRNTRALFAEIGMVVEPGRRMADLSVAEMQMVEIVKAISYDSDLIIMDEPTSAITDREVEKLFEIIRTLTAKGKAVIYISHKLDELFVISDEITVMRDGAYITTQPTAAMTRQQLIALMVGRELKDIYPRLNSERGEVVLEVENLASGDRFSNIDFKLYRGEILGIAGLMGAGRTELMKVLYGALPRSSGSVTLDGREVVTRSPQDGLANGIVYISEDRKRDGLVLGMSVKENMSLTALRYFSRTGGSLKHKDEQQAVSDFIRLFNVKTPSMEQAIGLLSGGNQQKVAIARGLMTRPKVLILDEPTRGVDVGAKKEIYQLINQFKADGLSIILVSSEMPEVLGMSDRIIVMHEGHLGGEFTREQATQEVLMAAAVGKLNRVNQE